MDLTLTKRGDYVLRAAIALANAWDGEGAYAKLRTISDDMGIPASYTPQILGLLARAGIAESRAGRHGGYRLQRSPRSVTVLEVIEAAEGPLAVARCPMRGGPCRWDDACAVHPTWAKATDAMRSSLARTSLAHVARDDATLASGGTVSPAAPPGHRPRRPNR
jgi:Rrf2 family protein